MAGILSHSDTPHLLFNNVDCEITENSLLTQLEGYGTVAWIKLIGTKHPVNNTIKATVRFSSLEEAKRCRAGMNGKLVNRYRVVVSHYINNMKPKGLSIFLTQLPEDLTHQELEEVFSEYGEIVTSRLRYNEAGVFIRSGFIIYRTAESVARAIEARNNTDWRGSKIGVVQFLSTLERAAMTKSNNLYVRGFPNNWDEEQLRQRFGEFGTITSIVKKEWRFSNQETKPYAFVCFQSAAEAENAQRSLHNQEEGGMQWFVQFHERKLIRLARAREQNKERERIWKDRNVYIRGLPTRITEDELKEILRPYAAVESIHFPKITNIHYDADGNQVKVLENKGIAYVLFCTHDDAKKAIEAFSNKIIIEDQNVKAKHWLPRKELKFLIRNSFQKRFPRQMYPQMFPMPTMQSMSPMPMQPMPMPPMQQPQMMRQPHSGPMQHQLPYGGMRNRAPGIPKAAPAPIPPPMPPAPMSQPQAGLPPTFAQLPPQQKKQHIGEKIFHKVCEYSNNTIAGKVTGMLLEMPEEDLVKLIQDDNHLRGKVQEAIAVLREAWRDQPDKLRDLP